MFECEQTFGSFKNSRMGVERCPIGPCGASLFSDKRVYFRLTSKELWSHLFIKKETQKIPLTIVQYQ